MTLIDENGFDDLVVILGSSDLEGALIYAETVTIGDPSFSGPLAGVSLGLDVYHILEPCVKGTVPDDIYQKNIGIWQLALGEEKIRELKKQFELMRTKAS